MKSILLCAAAAFLAICATVPAAPPPEPTPPRPPEESARIGKAIEDTLLSPQYRWRMPREKTVGDDRALIELELSFLDRLTTFFEKAGKQFLRFLRWLDKWLDKWFGSKDRSTKPSGAFDLPPRPLFFLAAAVASSVLAIMLYRAWRRRGQVLNAQAATPVAMAQPDPLAESTTADQLPMDRWMAMAHDLIAKGQFRAAMRAMFFACLAHLAREGGITLAKYKSNREYQRELHRRARDFASLTGLFEENIRMLECVWYGNTAPTDQSVDTFSNNAGQILATQLHPAPTAAPTGAQP